MRLRQALNFSLQENLIHLLSQRNGVYSHSIVAGGLEEMS